MYLLRFTRNPNRNIHIDSIYFNQLTASLFQSKEVGIDEFKKLMLLKIVANLLSSASRRRSFHCAIPRSVVSCSDVRTNMQTEDKINREGIQSKTLSDCFYKEQDRRSVKY